MVKKIENHGLLGSAVASEGGEQSIAFAGREGKGLVKFHLEILRGSAPACWSHNHVHLLSPSPVKRVGDVGSVLLCGLRVALGHLEPIELIFEGVSARFARNNASPRSGGGQSSRRARLPA